MTVSYYVINYLLQVVFYLRIADLFICVCVMVVPMFCSNDCELSVVYDPDTAGYAIGCGRI